MSLCLRIALMALVSALLLPAPSAATFSIAACDAQTGECGAATATHNLAVGGSVPFADAARGAGFSQLETNPVHSRFALMALFPEGTAEAALESALDADSLFNDGAGPALRQVGVVAIDGSSAAHTGERADDWAGHRTGRDYVIAGNGLAGPEVLSAMETTFVEAAGPLAERLLLALEAGQAAGGQSIGVLSAALLVSHPEGWPVDIDLRVDYAHGTAVADLRRAYDAHYARILLNRAGEAAPRDEDWARDLIAMALQRAPDWDRAWRTAATLAERMGDEEAAQLYRCTFATLNPVWAEQALSTASWEQCQSGE